MDESQNLDKTANLSTHLPKDKKGITAAFIRFTSKVTNVSPRARLTLTVGDQSFELKEGDVIGRGGTVAAHLLSTHKMISRRHLVVGKDQGAWYLMVLPSVTNSTFLDENEMKRGVRYPIFNQHTLNLAGQCSASLNLIEMATP